VATKVVTSTSTDGKAVSIAEAKEGWREPSLFCFGIRAVKHE